MIRSFADKDTERLFGRRPSRKLPMEVQRAALRKLEVLDAAEALSDLRVPPGNHLERLAGGRRGQHSIRINRQWRIRFEWHDGNAERVEIIDYHG